MSYNPNLYKSCVQNKGMKHKSIGDYITKTPVQNISYLNSKTIPENIEIKYREDKLEKLAQLVFSAPANNSEPENLFLRGPSGTGKTLCTKYWYNESVGHYDSSHKFIYINCKSASSIYSVMKKIIRKVTGDRGKIKNQKSMEYYMNKLAEGKFKTYVVILDEIDKILGGRRVVSGDDLLYELTRSKELEYTSNGQSISVVAISNKVDVKEKLCEGTQSSFGSLFLSFRPYNKEQLYEILLDRAKKGLKEEKYPSEGVGLEDISDSIADYVAKLDGDARTAIDILRHSAIVAKRKEREYLTLEDIDEAKYLVQKNEVLDDLRKMPDIARLVYLSLLVVSENHKGTRTNIKKAYRQLIDEKGIPLQVISKKQIGRYLDQMENRNLLDKAVDINSRGRPTVYSPDISGELLIKVAHELFKTFDKVEVFNEYFEDLNSEEKEALKSIE